MSCQPNDYNGSELHTWCTGCGNYGISHAVKKALAELQITPKNTLMCFDVGCNGNEADKFNAYNFHGLHGRSLAFAAGAAIANPNLTTIVHAGDGATLSEGINHFIHSIRNNYNVTFILHNNHNYALTTGQASCTTPADSAMDMYPQGTGLQPINVCDLALSLNASFVARGFSNHLEHLTDLIKQGINHKGFSFIEVLQDCPTYNKDTNNEWYWERIKEVQPASDVIQAKLLSNDMPTQINIGVLYQNKSALDFLNNLQQHNLSAQSANSLNISNLINRYVN